MSDRFPTAEEARILSDSKIKNQEEFLEIRKSILDAAKNGYKSTNYAYEISDENKAILQKAGYRLVDHTMPSINWITGVKQELHYYTSIHW